MSTGNKYDERRDGLSEAQAEALEIALVRERARQAAENNGDLEQMRPAVAAMNAVQNERWRQRRRWGDAHDDEHGAEELARQAASFLQSGQHPLPHSWAHKSKVIDRDPRRVQLVKGAALALAALEAYDRALQGRVGPVVAVSTPKADQRINRLLLLPPNPQ